MPALSLLGKSMILRQAGSQALKHNGSRDPDLEESQVLVLLPMIWTGTAPKEAGLNTIEMKTNDLLRSKNPLKTLCYNDIKYCLAMLV